MLSVIGNFDMTIGMRLHMLIYAAKCAVPIVGICYDPKISGFMDYAKQDKYVYAENIDTAKLIQSASEIFDNYDKTKADLVKTAEKMQTLAKENERIAFSLLQEGRK